MGANRDLDASRWFESRAAATTCTIRPKSCCKYFGRLMAIEVAVDQGKQAWDVEILVSAEHKHDFVAREVGPTPESAMDQCVHKIENQLRRYKEKVQNHKGDVSHGGRCSADWRPSEPPESRREPISTSPIRRRP